MLILTRRKGEAIMIGDDVTICVLSVEGSQVRVGIQAPQSLDVHRDEVYKRIHGENGRAQTGNLNHAQRSNLAGGGDPIVRVMHDVV